MPFFHPPPSTTFGNFSWPVDLGTGQYPSQGRLGLSVHSPQSAFYALFTFQLQAGVEIIKQLPIGSLDQRVDQLHHFGIVVSFIPKTLTDMSPILLFHMRVVVLLIRPTPGHEHRSRPLLQPAHHVIIQELSSVV